MSCATAWRAVSVKGAGQGSSRLCCRGAALVVVDGTGMGQIAANGPAATQRMPLAWPERSPGNEYVVENEVTTVGTCQGHGVPCFIQAWMVSFRSFNVVVDLMGWISCLCAGSIGSWQFLFSE